MPVSLRFSRASGHLNHEFHNLGVRVRGMRPRVSLLRVNDSGDGGVRGLSRKTIACRARNVPLCSPTSAPFVVVLRNRVLLAQ